MCLPISCPSPMVHVAAGSPLRESSDGEWPRGWGWKGEGAGLWELLIQWPGQMLGTWSVSVVMIPGGSSPQAKAGSEKIWKF